MSEMEDKLAKSLSAQTAELNPYLPYLLQDLWELGGMPEYVIELLQPYVCEYKQMKVLDLACGKGAIGIRLAKEFSCRVKGVDILPDFIAAARENAVKHGVQALCEFETGDIGMAVEKERDYDAVLYIAVGDVLGDPLSTLLKLRQTVGRGGLIVIDDAYAPEESDTDCYPLGDWLHAFYDAGVAVLGELKPDKQALAEVNEYNQSHIERRAEELKLMHPELSHLFDDYISSQLEECDSLSNELTGVTWLLGVS